MNLARLVPPPGRTRTALLLLFVAGGLAVLGLVLLGLPGAFFLMVADWLMAGRFRAIVTGDKAWPAAILFSIVAPFVLPPAYLLATTVRAARAVRVALTVALSLLLDVALALAALIAGGA